MSEQYDQVRRVEHCTLGDAVQRWRRDADAFTAGAQYALDRMLNLCDSNGVDRISLAGVDTYAAIVLTAVHEGRL